MANTLAYIVLFGWPLVVFVLFRWLPRAPALVWSVVGGYLVLPFGVGINLPVLPTFDKSLIPTLSALVMCLLGIAPFALVSRRLAGPARMAPAADAGAGTGAAPGRTRQSPPRPAPAQQDRPVRFPLIVVALVALLFGGQVITFVQNTAPARIGVVTLPGLRIYDLASMMMNTGVMLLPFGLGLRYLGGAEGQTALLRALCLGALAYSLPTLFEIRMSPQLARWVYGFLAQSFEQTQRAGGFRPVVFLQHGLWLALFVAMAALSGLALWRQNRAGVGKVGGGHGWLWAALWLALVLSLSNSLGAFALLLVLAPVVALLSVRGQLLMAAVLAVVVLTYPMLRGAGLVPVGTVYSLAAMVSEERAGSLKFRFDNEEALLARANEKPLAGWGGYGRSRVFDSETGKDTSVTDGSWVLVMGMSGWLGYLGAFGLLTLPVILLFLRAGPMGITLATAGLCLVLTANLVDMIANATLTPLTWLIAGALAGRCWSAPAPVPTSAAPEPEGRTGTRPAPQFTRPSTRRHQRALRRLVLAAALLLPTLGAPARADVSDPVLSFGLTGISDWSTQMAFVDLMKMSRTWIGHEPGKWGGMKTAELRAGGYLDADGWPMRIPPGLGAIGTIWDWGGSKLDPAAAASRAGVYVLTYEGKGVLQMAGSIKVLKSGPGFMMVQNPSGGTMMLSISSTDPGGTGDYIRNITLVRQDHVALHEAGQIFNPDWLAVVQDARELRFMDWMAVNGVTAANWDDRPQVGDVTWSGGVPVEVMVDLANQTGTEPWFTMPAGADEAYIRNFATYVRDHLEPGLQVHVEYSNEMWNWAFGQTKWLGAQAKSAWGSGDDAAWLDYAAMLATKSALIWDDVFGAQADQRLDHVLGTQTANPWIAGRLLEAPLWQKMDPEGYVAPASVFDSLAVTTYFGGSTMRQDELRAELLAVLKTPDVDATAWLAARLMDPGYDQSIPQTAAFWAANKAVADQYGLDLVAYEGGQHVLHSFAVAGLAPEDLAVLTTFLTGFVRSQAMADLYHALWTAWAAVSDGPFMQFGDVAAASKYGAWGLFSALGDHNPRADLLMELNAKTAPWF